VALPFAALLLDVTAAVRRHRTSHVCCAQSFLVQDGGGVTALQGAAMMETVKKQCHNGHACHHGRESCEGFCLIDQSGIKNAHSAALAHKAAATG
jgi:hypothetical protein